MVKAQLTIATPAILPFDTLVILHINYILIYNQYYYYV